ncbi:MAG TPA: DNA polymerase ligase N-terminal domain-containing protein [Vicinamibacterales bacterium]|nr:DNA polymerase ligase N-terminal domain-containing protein [Vicinamibacterales bacterium]
MASKPPLAEYKAKRDFTKTPEPAGAARPSPAGRSRFFCVQKHLASHLHYDFRLEHDGVLLSWAVPKGPSLDPAEKRLAMHVEDHPLDYGEFEGVIPEGYGAGIVMLWDRGTWEPEAPDVDAALKRGDLKMRLDGYKLKGSWVLVRTRQNEGRSWLLIKHRDEWAGELDILTFAPLSVKSGGDFADILAQDQPAIWLSNRPARGGEAGAMFQKIIERALALKAGQAEDGLSRRGPEGRRRKTGERKPTKAGAKTAGGKKAPARTAGRKTTARKTAARKTTRKTGSR